MALQSKSRTRQLALIGVVVVVSHPTSFAFPERTVGSAIENDIRLLVQTCFQGRGISYSSKFIPNDFQSDAHVESLNKPINTLLSANSVSLPLLSTRVFESLAPTTAQIRSMTTAGVEITLPASVPITSRDNLIYSLNCTSMLSLGIEQGFSLPLSGATLGLQNAFNAQAKGNAQSNLLIMRGQFESPLAAILDDTSPKSTRIATNSAIWLFYRKNSLLVNKPLYYIRSFRGWFSTNAKVQDVSAALNASGAVSASALLFSAKVDASAQFRLTSALSSSTFKLYFDEADSPNSPALTTTPLPTPDSVIGSINDVAEFEPNVPAFLYIKGVPIPISFMFPGLASSLCENNSWAISTDNGTAAGATTTSILSDGTCKVSAAVTPSLDSMQAISVVARQVQHPIRTSTAPLVDKNLQATRILRLSQSSLPSFYFVAQPKFRYIPESSPKAYRIEALISYYSDRTISNIRHSNLRIQCGTTSLNVGGIEFSNRERERLVQIEPIVYSGDQLPSECVMTLTATIDYDSATQGKVTISVPDITSAPFSAPQAQIAQAP